MIFYEIPYLLIIFVFLGILGQLSMNVDTIVVVAVIAYVLFEAFWFFILQSSKKELLSKNNVNHRGIKKAWNSMYLCALFRVSVVTVALFFSLRTEAVKISDGSFFDLLGGWFNGIIKCFIAVLCSIVSWQIEVAERNGYNKERLVLFNIIQIFGGVLVSIGLILIE